MTFTKTFLAVFLAILLAAGAISALRSHAAETKRRAEFRKFLFDAAIQHEGLNWQLHHAKDDPDAWILDEHLRKIREAEESGERYPLEFPE